ncbi:hypothetical protein GCM10010232_61340 [Streptomyces amakusaensis]|uniref:DUF3152 domain-containing protein n=1 Tax=Streptomyces amakusaensis TaxID=67271 RepID=A0ABW0ASA7_9ACTN
MGRRAPGRSSRADRRRARVRRRRRALASAVALAFVPAGLGGAALLGWPGDGDGTGTRAGDRPAPATSTAARPTPPPDGPKQPEPEPEPEQRKPEPKKPAPKKPEPKKPAPKKPEPKKPAPKKPAPKEPKHPEVSVPATGPGTFTPVRLSGERHGRGPVRRFRVEIEDGVRLPGPATARAVSDVLGHPRGWTRDSSYGFQLVESGPVDFTVKVATPGTTDRLCFVTTPASRGKVNCRVGHDVVVNLKLWTRGSPRFDGPVEEYRALIINHEVGHELGRGHETCPGPGLPAPAMMQQIKGLLGCEANAWPYDTEGRYVRGPSVP